MIKMVFLKSTILIYSLFLFTSVSGTTLKEVEQMLSDGNYEIAKTALNQIIGNSPTPLELSDILNKLGTVGHKMNEDQANWIKSFDKSIKVLSAIKPLPTEELALTHFQKSNCLINSAFIRIRGRRLAGMNSKERFDILKECVMPAQKGISKARSSYPKELKADLSVLETDIKMLMQLLSLNEQKDDNRKILQQQYKDCYQVEIKNNPTPRNDLLLYSVLRQVAISRQRKMYNETLLMSQRSLKIVSKNCELNLEARLQYAATELMNSGRLNNFAELEILLLNCTNEVEKLRANNISKERYFLSGSYFSKRVVVYELLLKLYYRHEKFEQMLAVIGQMKARAFKDLVRSESNDQTVLNIQKIQKNMKSEQAWAVEYFLGVQKSWLFILTGSELYCKEIGYSGPHLATLTKTMLSGYTNRKLLRYYKSNTNNSHKYEQLLAAYKASNELYKHLIQPLDKLSGEIKHLYIIPHNVSNYLPFSALVKKLVSDNLLLSEFYIESAPPLSYVPSLSLLEDRKTSRNKANSKIFYRSKFGDNDLCDLPNTITEACEVAKIIDGEILSGERFCESELFKDSTVDLLYIASHVKPNSAHPENSCVVLSSTKNSNLTVQDLINSHVNKLKTNLTILSLCQTNCGEEVPIIGDDLTTLSRAFLISGSHAVVTSQWEVTDIQTPMILNHLVKSYHTGTSPSRALDGALKQYMKNVKSIFYRHPFYWGNLLVLQKECSKKQKL